MKKLDFFWYKEITRFLSDDWPLLKVALSIRPSVGRSVCLFSKYFEHFLKYRFCELWEDLRKQKSLTYISRPQSRFAPDSPQKAPIYSKTTSKTKVKIEGNIENRNFYWIREDYDDDNEEEEEDE